MLHWIGAPKWALAIFLIVLAVCLLVLSYLLLRKEGPLVKYSRTGGIAGMRDILTVYPSGRAFVESKLIGSGELVLSEDHMAAIKLLLEELSPMGTAEYRAKPSAADFFSHSLVSERYGIELNWVDSWASEEIPFRLEAAEALMRELLNRAKGEDFKAGFGSSAGGTSMYAELDKLVVRAGSEVRIKVIVENTESSGRDLSVSGECFAAEVSGEGHDFSVSIKPLCDNKLLKVSMSFGNASVEVPIFILGAKA